MTELLQQAIAQIQQLPPDQQDAIAARFLAELQDEKTWETLFNATTDDQWDQMAASVRQEIASDATVPLDEVFPTQFVLAATIVFWACWNPIRFTGTGLAHMMNMTTC
jgi:hypothetical protein